MTAILELLKKVPFSAYLIGCLLMVLVVMYVDIERLHASINTEQLSIAKATDANNSNLNTIKDMQAAVDQWKQKCTISDQKYQDALAQLQSAFNRAADDNADMKRQLDSVYEKDTNAKAWGDTAVPDDVVSRLRAAALGRNQDR